MKKYKKNQIVIIAVLLLTIIYCFIFPKPKYVSPDIIPQLKIPYKISDWRGKDVAEELNLLDNRYNFISDIFARVYINFYGESLLLLILDAGNFHHPKVCFGSSGFKIKELNDTEFNFSNHKFKAHTLYTEKNNESFLIIYWICIDKKIVDWTEQKIKQLFFSLFNKEKVGLMIRLDIPTKENDIEDHLKLAKEFIKHLSQNIPSEQADYLFGEKN
ncbi:MAG: EpsI family protein [Candidatus Omnitrophica bacterium 4484_70.1]|nr:MAG: EpsI family protein [Candidatus Omnitrophica bacterium 4484_70.1]